MVFHAGILNLPSLSVRFIQKAAAIQPEHMSPVFQMEQLPSFHGSFYEPCQFHTAIVSGDYMHCISSSWSASLKYFSISFLRPDSVRLDAMDASAFIFVPSTETVLTLQSPDS